MKLQEKVWAWQCDAPQYLQNVQRKQIAIYRMHTLHLNDIFWPVQVCQGHKKFQSTKGI